MQMTRTFTASVTSKGQMTIPVEVRRHLGISEPGKVIVSITDDGIVEIRPSRFPDLDSLRGAAGSLDKKLTWDEIMRIAREDAYADETVGIE